MSRKVKLSQWEIAAIEYAVRKAPTLAEQSSFEALLRKLRNTTDITLEVAD